MRKNYNILISFDDNYVDKALKMLYSLKINNDALLNVYIYYIKLSTKSINKINSFFKEYNIGNLYFNKYSLDKKDFPMYLDHTSIETYIRLFVPFIIEDNIDKMLYLDCDIICNGDISKLYNTNIDNYYVAACENKSPLETEEFNPTMNQNLGLPKNNKYINAGVLLINIKKIKQDFSKKKIIDFIIKNKEILIMQDQDIINKLFYKKIKYLNSIYNYQINGYLDDELDESAILIHYSDSLKPWYLDYPSQKKAEYYYNILYKLNDTKELNKLMNNHENNSYEQNIVDIIIPVYNSLTTLERALDSIRNLNNKDRIRIYIIDDFSDESYGSTINKYDDLDIMYYRLDDNKGPGYARNYGLNHSNGEYVIFLDSDDSFFDSESVNVLVDAIEENDADEVRSIFRLISDNEEIDFYNDNLGLHGKIYRRSFIEDSEVMFAKTRSFEDTFFNTMIYLKNGSIIDIDNVTYFWYENDDSLTNTSDLDEKINDYYSNIIKAINLCKDNGERERIIEIIIDSLYFVYNNDYIIDSYLYQLSKLLNDYNVNIDEWLNEYEIEDLIEFKEFIYKYLNINKRLINEFNASNLEEKNKKLKEQFASFGEDNIIETPINTNCGGINVSIGSGVYINFGLSLVDNGNIYIGDNTFIGPNVSILTLNHGISKKGREEGEIEIKDVKIGKNVWIGAGVIILPGVTIGDNSVIGAGSIVTKNVPKNSLAFGNPCKVIKKI